MAGEPTFAPSVNPSFPFEEGYQPRVLSTPYGDGYIERAGDGINIDPQNLELTWENVTKAERDELMNFFKARAGHEAFLWTTPDSSTELKYIAPQYNSRLTDAGVYTVTASFQQVFDL
jgi:phage-related protein